MLVKFQVTEEVLFRSDGSPLELSVMGILGFRSESLCWSVEVFWGFFYEMFWGSSVVLCTSHVWGLLGSLCFSIC